MIRGRGISKCFNEELVLKDLDIEISKGSIYGLVGENGSGKSTLLKILNGIYEADSGEVLIGGRTPEHETRKQIFYMGEEVFFFRNYKFRDMAKFYCDMYESFSWDRFMELSEEFKLDTNKKMKNMSKGQVKQTALIIGLSLYPKLMILDEPLDGLDPKVRKKFRELIHCEIAEREMSTVISSHNLPEIESICDHIGVLKGGRIVISEDIDSVKGSLCKVVFATEDIEVKAEDLKLDFLNLKKDGKTYKGIVKGEIEGVRACLASKRFKYADVVEMSLEEIFLAHVEVKEDEKN